MVNALVPVSFRFALLALLALILASPVDAYSTKLCERGAFGSYIQKDYRDTRSRVLHRDAIGPLTERTASSGKVLVTTGSWHDPFTGRDLIDVAAGRVHIDHVIPVCWAWYRGAAGWSHAERRAFFNDMRYLIVVEAGLNMQKSDQGPDTFTPLNRHFRCDYVLLFLDGVERYELELSREDRTGLEQARAAACDTGKPPPGA